MQLGTGLADYPKIKVYTRKGGDVLFVCLQLSMKVYSFI